MVHRGSQESEARAHAVLAPGEPRTNADGIYHSKADHHRTARDSEREADMSESKRTPGTWDYIGDHVVGVVGDCECEVIPPEAEPGQMIVYPRYAHGSHDVVKPIFESGLPEGVTMEEHIANCHLIAAAPDLLEACEDIESKIVDYENGRINWRPDDFLQRIRAAVAKAKGQI